MTPDSEREIPLDSLWAYRNEIGGLPTFFLHVENVLRNWRLVSHTIFMATAVVDEEVTEVTHLTVEKFWRLVDAGKLERIDDPEVAIERPFVLHEP